jgi:hypothetical protein
MKILILTPTPERCTVLPARLAAAGHDCDCLTPAAAPELGRSAAAYDAFVYDRAFLDSQPFPAGPLGSGCGGRPAVIVTGAVQDGDGADGLPRLLHALATGFEAVAGDGERLTCHDLVVEPATLSATRGGVELPLTPTEYRVLECLVRHAGEVVTRRTLCDHVWSSEWHGMTNVVDVYVSRVRRKVDRGFTPRLIHTVRGVGYRLEAEHGPGRVMKL